MNLETAYGNFFKKKTNFPRFKSKKHKNSFPIPQRISLISKNIVQIPKFKEGLKFINHRELKGEIKNATISKSTTGKYYISFLCVVNKPVKHKKTGKDIGIDLGLKDFVITSDGQRYCNPKFTKKYEIKLARKQRILSRKQKGSKGRDKARLSVARVHEKITNSRNDMQHKVSSKLVKVIVIDRFYPSSKTCSCCDNVKETLSLDERTWTCSKCNTLHDRDVNASKNILRRALAIQSSGIDDYRNGAKVSPKVVYKATNGSGNEVLKKKNIRKYVLKPID